MAEFDGELSMPDSRPAHNNIRILFTGENWHGSNAASCRRAFRALGCDVLDIDEYHFFPQWESIRLKILRRLVRPLIADEFSMHVERQFKRFQPHLVFVFKGSMLRRHTLENLRKTGTPIFNFYPDVDLVNHHRFWGNDFLTSAPFYTCIFTPKSYQVKPLLDAGAPRVEFLPYAYDPWCHYPVCSTPEEKQMFASDIAFIGTWGKRRAEALETLVSRDFPYKLAIWGNQWERLSPSSPLRKFVRFKPATGATQAKVFGNTKIALAFLSLPDLHTARSFEIPAFGVLMLAERSAEHILFFEENREIACFEGVHELRDKLDYYLTHAAERQAIAQAGYEKVKGGHSYIDRMRDVLKVYGEIAERRGPAKAAA